MLKHVAFCLTGSSVRPLLGALRRVLGRFFVWIDNASAYSPPEAARADCAQRALASVEGGPGGFAMHQPQGTAQDCWKQPLYFGER
jgi:hypothetical protein